MKKYIILTLAQSILIFSSLLVANATSAQSSKDQKIIIDCDTAKAEFLRTDPLLKDLFTKLTFNQMIIFVSEKGKIIGKAKMSQVTVGFQVGGQAYRELIFFENKEALDRFKENKIEFSAQASAVAAKAGASANAKFSGGVMIYTQQKGGLMYEASVGGQKFKYSKF